MSNRMDPTRKRISQLEQDRESRRKSMLQKKDARKQEQLKNIAAGNPGDVDFIGMVEEWRSEQRRHPPAASHRTSSSASSNICIAVRKRPMSDKERERLDHDSVSCFPPQITVHSAKFKVDGITKYLTHNSFQFDHAFGVSATTQDIYVKTTLPLVDHVLATQGRATVFCYGQTGSGKTYTMNGIQNILAVDLYAQLAQRQDLQVTVAFFELYGGYIQDLLHDRNRCKLLQDGQGEVNITGLQEVEAPTPKDFLTILETGHGLRTTHTTEANDSSSRSHAICQVFLRQNGKLKGKLSLVDLAGSERGSDTKSHNSQRRAESADINTSLLSLKECIRAMGKKNAGHVPYRGSKLTLILKDCFSPNSKTTMIATVSPGASSTDHSLNTLRYADRIKEQRTTTSTTPKAADRKSTKKQTFSNNRSGAVSQERLERIAAAAAMDHETDAANSLVAGALSPSGVSQPQFDGFDDDDDDYDEPLLIASSSQDDDADEEYLEEPEPPKPTVPVSKNKSTGRRSMSVRSTPPPSQEPTEEDEVEMRETVQRLFELEEALLNQHMSNIQENADMLTREGKMLQQVRANPDEAAVDDYAIQLAEFLDRKEILIYKLQQRLQEFKRQLAKEQRLAQRVTKLTQY